MIEGQLVTLRQVLTPEVVFALAEAGFEVVEFGSVPRWFERVESIPAEVYRKKRIED